MANDYSNYENAGLNFNTNAIIEETYGNSSTIKMPEGTNPETKAKMPDKEGKESLLHTINVIHYGAPGSNLVDSYLNKPERFFAGNNPSAYRNPTGSKIVEVFNESSGHNMIYRANDFLFLDHYGKVPNNLLLTLRRFPGPVSDNIRDIKHAPLPDVARLLGFIDGELNKIEDVFKFSAGFNWKEFKSEIQTQERSKTGWGGLNMLGAFDTTGRYAQEKLQGQARTNFDPYTSHQDNYTWGPIDVIDKLWTRDVGLKFEGDLKLTFRYAVKSYNGINTRVVFMDIIGNALNMITNKAPFWGGAVRFQGGEGYSGPLGDMEALRRGDIGTFAKSFATDLMNKIVAPFEKGILAGAKQILGNMAAKMLGGSLDKLQRPEQFGLHSLLSGAPTGEWHLTVGNPFNPAMMMGNLIVDTGDIEVEGPFTADDVPSYVIITINLKHAMPRDKYAIQSMFNYGKGRYYGSDIDFQNRSYYRNRGASSGSGGGKKGGGNAGANVIDSTINPFVETSLVSEGTQVVKSTGNKAIDYATSAFKTN